MDDVKRQIIDKLQNANNILVTVSANPSVDQLAACIGLTLLLNKLNKHATAVFSGKVPSTIEFLKPEETLETNTDSLRDFIIALDKAKADKLRYKVEDEVVKIFITPYKSSITEKDLVFSQGDFNVDVVMALGVRQAQDLDDAITAHGRILHDAVVICVNTAESADLGTINWQDSGASGVSELVTNLAGSLGPNLLDAQISTALLTGIVAETGHFSNEKTTPQTMTSSATLLAAGANQQLVSTELADKQNPPKPVAAAVDAAVPVDIETEKPKEDGELDVPHDKPDKSAAKSAPRPAEKKTAEEKPASKMDSSERPTDKPAAKTEKPRMKRIEPLPETTEPATTEADTATPQAAEPETSPTLEEMVVPAASAAPAVPPEPAPSHDIDTLLQQAEEDFARRNAAELPQPNPQPSAPVLEVPPAPEGPRVPEPSVQDAVEPADPVTIPVPAEPEVTAPPQPSAQDASEPAAVSVPVPPAEPAEKSDKTLSDIEESVHSPHIDLADDTDVDSARKAVEDALKGAPDPLPEPLERTGAVAVDLDLGHDAPPSPATPDAPQTQPGPGVPPPANLPDYLQTPSTAQPVEPGPAPIPAGINVPPPQAVPPTSTTQPPQGPPPPPSSPPPIPNLGQ